MREQALVAGETRCVPIEDIKLHADWPYRRDLGHIDGLSRSLSGRHGLLQPIGIDPSGNLIWGLRRLTAAKKLGWQHILARVVDFADPLTAMKEENDNRLNLSPSEMTRIMSCIEANERGKANARQAAAGPSSCQGAN